MAGQTEGVDYVIAPHAIQDPDLERNVYGAGDKVPMDDAVKYGLVEKPSASRAKKGPEENRAKKTGSTRKASAKKR